ncbi:hypothetical protein TUMEXPCC7403_11160 [Tumidithrix helvetica PCC 7403]|uniref:beta strand repeat-containing protein n=1 Tax=Tumidithrix helvetica TaxID=3457545 RepID=UPI003C7F5659
MKETFIGLSVAAIAFNLIPTSPIRAQVTPDKTLPVNTIVNTNGTTFTITGGTQVGGNQFHSFEQFSVPTGNTAYFNNSPETANIISRVTGSSISNVDGLIKANGQANLFLVNPNGIIFGQNARLDIGGSFTATTANSIKFADGSEFSATNPSATPLLTMSAPIGLQYGKSLTGATIANQGNLSAGQDLTLAADKLDLQGQLQAGRDLNLQAQDSVKIRDTSTNPFIAISGRDMTIQGNQNVDIFTLNHPQTLISGGRNLSLISNGDISGDAHFFSGGNLSVLTTDGNPGSLISLFDPLIFANGNVSFGNYSGIALKVEAKGSIKGGNITITGAECRTGAPGCVGGIPISDPDFAMLTGGRALILRAGLASVNTPNLPRTTGGTTFTTPPSAIPLGISVGNITTSNTGTNNGGDIILSALNGNISTGTINSRTGSAGKGGSVIVNSSGNITIGNITTSQSFVSGSGQAGSTALLANGNVALTNYTGGSLQIMAGGSVTSTGASINLISAGKPFANGNVTFNGAALNLNSSSNVTLSNGTILNLNGTTKPTIDVRSGMTLPTSLGGTLTNANITLTDIFTPGNSEGLVFLTNQYNANSLNGNIQVGNSNTATTGSVNGGKVFIDSRGNITTSGSVTATSASGNGGSVNLLAKNDITTSSIATTSNTGNGGSVNLLTSIGNITTNGNVTTTSTSGNGGAVTFNSNGSITSNGNVITSSTSGNGGSVNLLAKGNIGFGNNASILSNGSLGGAIDINSKGIVSGNGLFIRSLALNPNNLGKSGDINITANSLNLANSIGSSASGAFINTSTSGNADAGNITLNIAGDVMLTGEAGGIKTQLVSQVQQGAKGNGGNITVNAKTGVINISNGAQIFTSTDGLGKGGDIGIYANAVNLANKGAINSQVLSNANAKGGNLTVQANTLTATNEAQLTTTNSGLGTAGNLNILVNGNVVFDRAIASASIEPSGNGIAGNLSLNARSLQLLNGSQILAAVFGKGTGGNISIQADAIALDGFGVVAGRNVPTTISTSIELPTSSGISGNIDVNANTISLTNGAIITAYSNGKGNSGGIKITANSLNISSGAQIQTNTLSSGNAGNVSLFLSSLLQLDGSDSAIRAGTGPNSTGLSGSIFIDPSLVNITNGARISVSSLGTGNGGNIQLLAGSLFLDNNGIIRAESANGEGGNIFLKIQDLLFLRHGSQISATAGNNGNGGNITIDTGFLIALPFENSDISANADRGRGGNINVTAQAVYGIVFRPALTPLSDFTVSSNFNLSGTVIINTPGIDPSRGLGNLPVDVVDASKLVPQRCLADKQGSEFIITGRGGVPANPSELLSGMSLLDNLGTSHNSVTVASNPVEVKNEIPDTIVEAQGWVVGDRGQITLVAKAPAAPSSVWSSQPKCVPVAQK